jgi:hypothetical protein
MDGASLLPFLGPGDSISAAAVALRQVRIGIPPGMRRIAMVGFAIEPLKRPWTAPA